MNKPPGAVNGVLTDGVAARFVLHKSKEVVEAFDSGAYIDGLDFLFARYEAGTPDAVRFVIEVLWDIETLGSDDGPEFDDLSQGRS